MGEDEAGQRADRVVAAHTSLSREDLRALFDRGAVRCAGKRIKRGTRLAEGDCLEIDETAPLSTAALPDPSIELQVVYEDSAVVVVDKPAGMATHPLRAGETGCLANGLLARYPELVGVGYEPRQPGLVNRLDNDTSGLVIAARTHSAFASLRRILSEGRIRKRYVGACDNLPDRHALRWVLAPDPRDPRRMVYEGERPGLEEARFQSAISNVVREATGPSGTFVTVQADRAVRHQVRCHLAAAGAPLCGDALYGGRPLPGGRHLLHASEIMLPHPDTGARLEVKSPVPEGWVEQLRTRS